MARVGTAAPSSCQHHVRVSKEESEQGLQRSSMKQARLARVRQELAKSMPKCQPAMPVDVLQAVWRWAFGGTDAGAHAMVRNGNWELSGSRLCEPKPKDSDPYLRFRHALLQLAYGCPIDRFVTVGDVRKLYSKSYAQNINQANRLMGIDPGSALQASATYGAPVSGAV